MALWANSSITAARALERGRWSPTARYSAAILSVALVWVLRLALNPVLGDLQPFALFFIAVLFMSWWAGVGPAILATVLGWLAGDWFFSEPRGSILSGGPSEITTVVVYLIVSTILIVLSEQMRRVQQRLQQDISARKQIEQTLKRQARLIDLAPVAIFVRSIEGKVSFWSDGAHRLYGWTRQEAIGRRSDELLRTEFPIPIQEIILKVRTGEEWSGELTHRAKNGRLLIVESHWLGQFTPEGELGEILESNLNITERKRTEQELLHLKDDLEFRVEQRTAELASANKELESFGYSVSHDLRAPLRHIDSYIRLLDKSAGPNLDDQNRRYVRVITEAAARIGNLIDDLLMLSRLGRATMQESEIDLRQLVDAVRQELAPMMSGRAIEWQVGVLPQIRGDANLLRSALTNLLSNALKYTRGRNPARIEIGAEQRDFELIVFIGDNGAGFDMRFVDKLFGVFQRLHRADEFEGTGIGLASVRRVIQRHGGQTWAQGEFGRGASFYFSLPISRVLTASKGQQ